MSHYGGQQSYYSQEGGTLGGPEAWPGTRKAGSSVDLRKSRQSQYDQVLAPQVVPQSTFTFQERRGRIEMGRLAAVDIERVVRTRDIDALQVGGLVPLFVVAVLFLASFAMFLWTARFRTSAYGRLCGLCSLLG